MLAVQNSDELIYIWSLSQLKVEKKKYRYAPSPSLPVSFHPFPSPFPLLPCPTLPLEVGPLKSSWDTWGSAVSFPSGSGEEPRPQTHFWHILRLGIASGRNNFNDISDDQLIKFHARHSKQ